MRYVMEEISRAVGEILCGVLLWVLLILVAVGTALPFLDGEERR